MRPHCVRWGSARRRVGQSVRGSSAAAVAQRSRPALPPKWLQPAQCGRPCGSSRASARAAQRAARQRRSTRRAEGACRFQRKISAAVVAVQRSATDQHGARVRALMQQCNRPTWCKSARVDAVQQCNSRPTAAAGANRNRLRSETTSAGGTGPTQSERDRVRCGAVATITRMDKRAQTNQPKQQNNRTNRPRKQASMAAEEEKPPTTC